MIHIYRAWEEAAKASRSGQAISDLEDLRPTPNGRLPALIVISPGRSPKWVYKSATGIDIPPTYGRPTRADVDSITRWKAY